jgi:hypothetical protein
MTAALAAFVPLYCALLACWALVCGLRGTRLSVSCVSGLVLLELSASTRAAVELVELATAPGGFGRGYAEPAVHVGYLVASVVVLPLVFVATGGWTTGSAVTPTGPRSAERGDAELTGTERTDTRSARVWDGVIAALGCVALSIVTVRLGTTGRPG